MDKSKPSLKNTRHKPKILMVDDKPENLLALERLLRGMDVELFKALSGNEALVLSLHHEFALALLDIQMPDMDGYELAGIFREEEKTAHMPFIFISAIYTDNINIFKGYEKGAFSYITKPFEPELLLNKVRFFIEKYRQEQVLILQTKELKKKNRELQVSEQELKEINGELKTQTEELTVREEELQSQNEEINLINALLEQKNQLLEEKNHEIEEEHKKLEALKQKVDEKARKLELASQYKSEFLANMSHELRTPLNSILLLSKLMAENQNDNLTAKQIEYSEVINKAGEGLLVLINDILDLSKIESGKMALEFGDVNLADIVKNIGLVFNPVAQEKDLRFTIKVGKRVPKVIRTDQFRVEQVLKNLLSNAFKFTERGQVEFKIFKPAKSVRFRSPHLIHNQSLGFAVSDTGIGIRRDKKKLVFNAFQQADGSTQRKYGGTGLGLSICKEIAHLFGGDITLESLEGKGSTFTVFLPQDSETAYKQNSRGPSLSDKPGLKPDRRIALRASKPELKVLDIPEEIPDDRKNIKKGEKTILIIEDDVHFAELLLNFSRERGYKGVVAVSGDKGVEYAKKYKPYAIVLDIKLPVMDGWTVMEELKRDSRTKSIPVHIFSNLKEVRKESLESGALDFANKPVYADQLNAAFNRIEAFKDKKIKSILVVDKSQKHQLSLKQYLDNGKWNLFSARNARQTFLELGKKEIDCLILDLELPDANGFEVLQKIKQQKKYESLPVIVYTAKGISSKEEKEIRTYASTIIMKTAKSYERILEELNLFLHVMNQHQEGRPKVEPHCIKEALKGKRALLIDDDIRNILSLTELLEDRGMQVISAGNGTEALQLLDQESDIDLVLTDIMMPQMDGYETIKRIRKQKRYKRLPIIAVTAKAMPVERDKCISAGASDYISKPFDVDQLLSVLKVWLCFDQSEQSNDN